MRARALYVAFDVYPRPKGSSSHIASMLAALARDFAPVCLLCLGDPELPPFESANGVETHRLPGPYRDVLQRATAFAQFVAFHASRLAESLELIVFRDPWGGVPAMRALPDCPAVFEVNALPTWELAYSRPGFAESATLPAKLGDMQRFCLRRADEILCVSSVTRRALIAEDVDASKITIIPNAASEIFFNPPSSASPIPALKEGQWIGYIGGLQSWQGVEFLIDSFALAAPEARLLIVHSGNRDAIGVERRIARHRLGAKVLLHPPLAPPDLASVFQTLHFTAAPLTETARNTWQGCCPVKIVESMAAGTPVIASDLAVSRELIEHEHNGLLIPPGDLRLWAHAIQRLCRDAQLRQTLAANTLRTARKHFAQSVAHEQLSAVFRRAASRLPA